MAAITEIFSTYSLPELIGLFSVTTAAAISGYKALEYVYGRLRTYFRKGFAAESKEDALNKRIEGIEQHQCDTDDALAKFADSLDFFSDKLEVLIDSDKDSIKAYLTDKHHYYCHSQGWIDDYNLDCIERRYVHYKKAGGNSFVDHLMEELRALPTYPASQMPEIKKD